MQNTNDTTAECRVALVNSMLRYMQDLKKNRDKFLKLYASYDMCNSHTSNEYSKNIINLRKSIKLLQDDDVLAYKELRLKDRTRKRNYTFFTDVDGIRKSRYRSDETPLENRLLKENYIIFYKNSDGRKEELEINTAYYWLDDVVKAIKSGNMLSVHNKLYHFRIGDEFYSNNKYLLYNGQAYERSKYALDKDNSLVDLSKSLVMKSCYTYYGSYNTNTFRNVYYLNSEDDEQFEHEKANSTDTFLRIHTGYSNYRGSLLPCNFFLTMFVVGKKRIFNDANSYINLTKEQCMELDFKPTQEHKKILKKITEDFRAWRGSGPFNVNNFYTEVGAGACFEITYCDNNSKGIQASIIKELFQAGHSISCNKSTKEIRERLATLRELLAKEKEYAERKQSRKKRAA